MCARDHCLHSHYGFRVPIQACEPPCTIFRPAFFTIATLNLKITQGKQSPPHSSHFDDRFRWRSFGSMPRVLIPPWLNSLAERVSSSPNRTLFFYAPPTCSLFRIPTLTGPRLVLLRLDSAATAVIQTQLTQPAGHNRLPKPERYLFSVQLLTWLNNSSVLLILGMTTMAPRRRSGIFSRPLDAMSCPSSATRMSPAW